MKFKIIAFTSRVNRKGIQITKKAIIKQVDRYNKREKKIPMLISHDYTLGIIGIVDKMDIEKYDDGEIGCIYEGTFFDDLTPEELKEKLKLIIPHIELLEKDDQKKKLKIGSFTYLFEDDIVYSYYPKIQNNLSRYNLLIINDEMTIDYFGVKVEDLLIPFHAYFHRNHSLLNLLYYDLIEPIITFHKKHPECKLALRPAFNFIYEDFPKHRDIELDYWRGSGFNKDFQKLDAGVTVYHYSDYSGKYGANFYDIYVTEFWVTEDRERNVKILSIEEIRHRGSTSILFDNTNFHFTRYLHCEFDVNSNKVIHFDIAIRLYTAEQYDLRFKSNDIKYFAKNIGKPFKKDKLLQVDGLLELNEMLEIIYPFFHNNPLLFEYFEENIQS